MMNFIIFIVAGIAVFENGLHLWKYFEDGEGHWVMPIINISFIIGYMSLAHP